MRMKESRKNSDMKNINTKIILFDLIFNIVCMIFAWRRRSDRIDSGSDGGSDRIFGNRYSCNDPKKKRSQFFDIGLFVDVYYAEGACNFFHCFVSLVFGIVDTGAIIRLKKLIEE